MRLENARTRSLLVGVVCLFASSAGAVDLVLDCEGTQRRPGTAYERDIEFELEFDWTAESYRMFEYEDNVRTLMSEGPASEDNNVITWSKRHYTIDRRSGGMTRRYSMDGQQQLETLTCKPTGHGKLF